MKSIIFRKDDFCAFISDLQDFLKSGSIIKDIRMLDENPDSCIVLIDEKEITDEKAEIFWEGFQAALK